MQTENILDPIIVASDVNSLLPVINGILTIDKSTVPGSVIAEELNRINNGNPIIVNKAHRVVSSGIVTVTGTASLLNLQEVSVTAVGQIESAGPVVKIRFALVNSKSSTKSWIFSDSFPQLPPFFPISTTPLTMPDTLLNRLPFNEAAFVLSTASGQDKMTGVSLQPGFNFVALCNSDGIENLIGMFGHLLSPSNSIKLGGLIIVPTSEEMKQPLPAVAFLDFPWGSSIPGIHLILNPEISEMGFGNKLELSNVSFTIFSPTCEAWANINPTYVPDIMASGSFTVPSLSQSPYQISAFGLSNSDALLIYYSDTSKTQFGLDKLLDLIGASDLLNSLPSQIKSVLGNITLNALGIQLKKTATGNGILFESINISIGLPNVPSSILGKLVPTFTITNLGASFNILNPFPDNSTKSFVTARLSGSIPFSDQMLDLSITLPDNLVTASITNVSIDLQGLFTHLGLTFPKELSTNLEVSEIALEYNNGNFEFSFYISDKQPWTFDPGIGTPLTIENCYAVINKNSTTGVSWRCGGTITLGQELSFEINYQKDGGDDETFTGQIACGNLAEFIGLITDNRSYQLPEPFQGFTDLDLTLDFSKNKSQSSCEVTLNIGSAVIDTKIIKNSAREKTISAEFSYSSPIDLMQYIPIIGTDSSLKFTIQNFGAKYTSNPSSFNLNSTLNLGGQIVTIPKNDPTKNNSSLIIWDPKTSPQSTPTISYPIQKALGPLMLQKIGMGWANSNLEVTVNATLSLVGLEFSLIGFGIGFPLDNPSPNNWSFNLDGLGLSFIAGPVEIAGSLIKQPAGKDLSVVYNGELIIKLEEFGLVALGSLSVGGNSPTSLFVFAFIEANLGGPPFFFVTGLSFGFGYNRSLIPPPQEDVALFPLVAGLNNSSPMGSSDPQTALASALSYLDGSQPFPGQQKGHSYIPVTDGEYWIAAGVQFSTFELLTTNALFVVEVGKEFELILLGKSVASLPPIESFSYLELGIEVVFNPGAGFFTTSAVLSSNSYLFDKNCHLTGGFAFDAWFGSNAHAGDFVLTLGGYHPKFIPPSYYPKEPRVGINWQVDSNISIKGGVYFALTPSCMMGGGSLEALFQSGPLQAWYIAYADFLIYWKPFYFTADMGVCIGVAFRINIFFVTVTLKVELAATMHLWGPPTGGTVHVEWYIISFTVSFGTPQGSGTKKLLWKDFAPMLTSEKSSNSKQIVLNEETTDTVDSCQINVSFGLVSKTSQGTWIIRADEFTFSVTSQIPLTEINFQQTTLNASYSEISIRPMGINNTAQSILNISVTSSDSSPIIPLFTYSLKKASLPKALWGVPSNNPSNIPLNDRLLDDALIGLESISAPSTISSGRTGIIEIVAAFGPYTIEPFPVLLPTPSKPVVFPNKPTVSTNVFSTISTSIMNPSIVLVRTAIFNALQKQVGFQGKNGTVSNLAKTPMSSFEAEPLVGALPTQAALGAKRE